MDPGVGGPQGGLGVRFTPRPVLHLPSFSALHHAALNGNTELISLLLEAQAAVDIKDNKGKPGLGGLEAKGREQSQGWKESFSPRHLPGLRQNLRDGDISLVRVGLRVRT